MIPGMCASCGHANATHSSQGCLWSLAGLSCLCRIERES